jgi:NAD dependent epimerase/dehydratase family enzyme
LIFPAIPTWFLKIILGEMADLVTGGNFVSSEKIQKELTFTFKFTSFSEAIKKLKKEKKCIDLLRFFQRT